MKRFKWTVLLLIGLLTFSSNAFSCPKIGSHQLVDFNCDEIIHYTFTGDSIVKGVGDETFHGVGGYVKRTKFELVEQGVKIYNLGVAGTTTFRLLRDFKRNLHKKVAGKTQRATYGSDVFLVDVGRNDYWENRTTESEDTRTSRALRNMKRLRTYLMNETKKNGGEAFVFFSTLIPTTRSFQRNFVDLLNQKILAAQGKKFPVLIRMDTLKTKILAEDGLHPSSSGYQEIARKLIIPFFEDDLAKQLEKNQPDKDNDGIYDAYELEKFGTDPNLTDTDGDGAKDGDEVFVNGTNALDPNSF